MARDPLVYRMVMALNAADIGQPICDQAASICAEIAEQYCSELHLSLTAPSLRRGRPDVTEPDAIGVRAG